MADDEDSGVERLWMETDEDDPDDEFDPSTGYEYAFRLRIGGRQLSRAQIRQLMERDPAIRDAIYQRAAQAADDDYIPISQRRGDDEGENEEDEDNDIVNVEDYEEEEDAEDEDEPVTLLAFLGSRLGDDGWSDEGVRRIITENHGIARDFTVTSDDLTTLIVSHEVGMSVETLQALHNLCGLQPFQELKTNLSISRIAKNPSRADLVCSLIDYVPSLIIPSEAEMPKGEVYTTPLHQACDGKSWKVIKKICETNPEAIMVEDGEYMGTAVHNICRGRFRKGRDEDIKILKYLVSIKPDVLLKVDSAGCTPLSWAAGVGESDFLMLLVKLCPEAAKIRIEECLPLNDCMYNNNEAHSVEAIGSLINAHPPAVRSKDTSPMGSSRTPLHNVFRNQKQYKPEIVKLLLEKGGPAIAKLKERNGEFPLHSAMRFGHSFVSIESINALLEAHPGAAFTANKYGQTPVHILCEKSASRFDLLQRLLEISTAPLTMKTKVMRKISFVMHRGGIHHVTPDATPHGISLFRLEIALKQLDLRSDGQHSHELRNELGLARDVEGQDIHPDNAFLRILQAFKNVEETDTGETKDSSLREALVTFHEFEWPRGVAMILEKNPHLIDEVFSQSSFSVPFLLSLVGNNCSLECMFKALKRNPFGVEVSGLTTDSKATKKGKRKRK